MSRTPRVPLVLALRSLIDLYGVLLHISWARALGNGRRRGDQAAAVADRGLARGHKPVETLVRRR